MMPPEEAKSEKSVVQKTNYDEGIHVASTEYALTSKQDVDSEVPKNPKLSSSSSEKVLQGSQNQTREKRVQSPRSYISSAFEDPLSPSSSVSQNIGSDATFEPTIDMMVNDFDDEQTLNEEEALAALESQDPQEEIDTLKEESEIPLEELLAKYQAMIEPVELPRKKPKKTNKRVKIKNIASAKKDASNDKISGKEKESNNLINEMNDEDESASNDILNESIEDDLNNQTTSHIYENGVEKKLLKRSHLLDLYPEQSFTPVADEEREREVKTIYFDDDYDDDYDDEDEETVKKTIMVGNAYQAVIPFGLSQYGDILPYENEDKLIWEPTQVSEQEVEEYLLKVRDIKPMLSDDQLKSKPTDEDSARDLKILTNTINTMPNGKENIPQKSNENKPIAPTSLDNDSNGIVKDNEQALHLLVQCGYDFNEALRRKRLNVVPLTGSMSLWSEEECQKFEEGIQKYGKDFLKIRQNQVRTRTMRELVQFYYLWKKSERRDNNFANSNTVDHMDIYLNEEDDFGPHNNAASYMSGLMTTTNNGSNTRKIPNNLQKSFLIMAGNSADTVSNTQANTNTSKIANKKQKNVPTDETSSAISTFNTK
ncbi:mesoderm induction early response protein 1 [Teleopsis dalmanni]|uniref:mesoderm induction early response protein 1 n=1 Tax=Teleopsis dalmanni TaxID=139649 RepID=UPI0018CC91A9|nr:mesoderm induction early response protein 1 [Teleopsis dalmanni]XP_037952219.1 mesoderm induction early response protein 1 [Teleopsis dalmanni]